MIVAIVGSRNLNVEDLGKYLPANTTQIVSGGARGVDAAARAYAVKRCIPYKEFPPNYERYGRCAPLKRNDEIVAYAELVLAFWDGSSRGTKYTIDQCRKTATPVQVIMVVGRT